MSRKPNLLQSVLKGETKDAQAAPAVSMSAEASNQSEAAPRQASDEDTQRPKRDPVARAEASATYIAPSRAGKTAKTHYLPVAYWDTLAEVAFRTRDENGKRASQERLIAEALNLLFQKYNYPIVRE